MISFFALVMLAAMLIAELVSGQSKTTEVISFGLLFIGMWFLAEIAWLLFVAFWAIRLTILMWPARWAFVSLLAGATIIWAHFSGMKLYGSRPLYDNRPLFESALTLDHLELPNIMVATDGSRHVVKGIRWVDESGILFLEDHLLHSTGVDCPARFAPATGPAFPSGYAIEARQLSFCGNSFYPVYFPRRLPRYHQKDVAEVLRHFISISELAGNP